ncbi:MAG: GNAT family N-acetyltransferase [Reyranella sp.]|uniref:GNAT family N-acetyltransferase n=1 Tax=Reyranella sp. TaxID=1929291 RepID=UPI00122616DD|nr:GNAT family N-acetyltransferase [Reyranella sp.]TAJ38365.1 MAG: GNAT family N-acetyltransferase [Reyranella sp.]
MSFEVNVASADDIARMAGWAADEGWNPGNTDALAFHAADPGAFLIGRLDGRPVACISVVRYGTGFGFLGFYIARPEARGKGYGIKVWDAGMARLKGRNVGLDGVVAQQHNYKKSGFRSAWNNIRHEGPSPPLAAPPAGVTLVDARAVPFDRIAAYDRRFFPEARDHFLAPWVGLPERAGLVAMKDGELQGMAVIRTCRAAARIGPLYAASPEIAAALVSELAQKTGASAVAIDVPDRNKAAVKLAEGMGLKPAFETARMYTGADPVVDYAGLFGVTSLELG